MNEQTNERIKAEINKRKDRLKMKTLAAVQNKINLHNKFTLLILL